jgi:hypothetical protein
MRLTSPMNGNQRSSYRMGMFILDNGTTVFGMEGEDNFGRTGLSMRATGKTTWQMV